MFLWWLHMKEKILFSAKGCFTSIKQNPAKVARSDSNQCFCNGALSWSSHITALKAFQLCLCASKDIHNRLGEEMEEREREREITGDKLTSTLYISIASVPLM